MPRSGIGALGPWSLEPLALAREGGGRGRGAAAPAAVRPRRIN